MIRERVDFSSRICPLFCPGNRPEYAEKLLALRPFETPDVVVFDLEDSLPASARDGAREELAVRLARESSYRAELDRKYPGGLAVRINSFASRFFHDDLRVLNERISPDYVILPKVCSALELESTQESLGSAIECVPVIETILGFRRREEIFETLKGYARTGSVIVGYEDLSYELGIVRPRDLSQPNPLNHILNEILLSASFYGQAVFDGVSRYFREEVGLHLANEEARFTASIGARGKFAIHPSQVAGIRNAFDPRRVSDEAARSLRMFEEAAKGMRGVIVTQSGGVPAMEDLPSQALAYKRMAHRNSAQNFGTLAKEYSLSRPRYPEPLFDFLARQAPGHSLAWDAGTGNGQAAERLARHFKKVVATDIDPRQLDLAMPHPAVTYHERPCQQSGLEANSVDLVSAATAVHWFPLEAFYGEVERVLKPEGIFAVWSYLRPVAEGRLDELLAYYYDELLIPLLPAGQSYHVRLYRDLPFPAYEEIAVPPFEIVETWNRERLLEMMRTPSPRQEFMRRFGRDPLSDIETELKEVLAGLETFQVRFPLSARVGRKPRARLPFD